MTVNGTKIESVVPVLESKNLAISLKFYTEILGFESEYEWIENDTIIYAVISIDGFPIHITKTAKKPKPSRLYIFCDEVSNLYAEYQKKKANFTDTIAEHAPGMHEFEVADPDDNRLIFGEGSDE